jgi:hypothetical protein
MDFLKKIYLAKTLKTQRSQSYYSTSFNNKFKILFLLLTFLFIGCSQNGSPSTNETGGVTLNGSWISEFDDGYIINLSASTLKYDDGGYGTGYDGTIVEIVKFNNSGTAGVILIKYINKPFYFATEDQPAGDYIGIYFRKLTSKQGEFSTPYTEEDPIPAKTSFEEAKTSFTEDKTGDYISFWSVCIKK